MSRRVRKRVCLCSPVTGLSPLFPGMGLYPEYAAVYEGAERKKSAGCQDIRQTGTVLRRGKRRIQPPYSHSRRCFSSHRGWEIDIIPMGIFKTEDFIPHGVDLFRAVSADGLDIGGFVKPFSLFRKRGTCSPSPENFSTAFLPDARDQTDIRSGVVNYFVPQVITSAMALPLSRSYSRQSF